MLKKHALTLALVAAILLLIALNFRPQVGRGLPTSPPAPPALATLPNPKPETPNPKPKTSPREVSTLADALNSPSTDIRADLRLVSEIIDTFRTNFPSTGNPVGSNPEITAILTGKNKLRLALIPPNHPAINRATGELCDRWGTPFYFHAESGTKMEIRSAGPDKKLHTPDDILRSP